MGLKILNPNSLQAQQQANQSFLKDAIKIVGKEVVLKLIDILFGKKKKGAALEAASIPNLSPQQLIKLNGVLVTMLLDLGAEQLVQTFSNLLKKVPKENLAAILKPLHTVIVGVAKSKRIPLT